MIHTFNYDRFMDELTILQEKMLFLEKEEAQSGFKMLFEKARPYFKNLFDEHKSSNRKNKNYFVKKQSELLLRYINNLEQSNVELIALSDAEVLRLFEKQYKFKKILYRLRNHLQKN